MRHTASNALTQHAIFGRRTDETGPAVYTFTHRENLFTTNMSDFLSHAAIRSSFTQSLMGAFAPASKPSLALVTFLSLLLSTTAALDFRAWAAFCFQNHNDDTTALVRADTAFLDFYCIHVTTSRAMYSTPLHKRKGGEAMTEGSRATLRKR